MRVLDGAWDVWEPPPGSTSITIGVLDGVHRGHRELLRRLDPSHRRTVLTFEPHPVEVLRPGTSPRLLTTIEERLALLDDLGVELVGVLDLAGIKEQSPEEFVRGVLVHKLAVGQLVVGEDFRFGHDRAGDVGLLRRMGSDLGFDVDVIDLVADEAAVVSSSRIRSLIEEGDVGTASELMGSWFTLSNVVVQGDRRGRELGFPTANLRPPSRKVIPGHGVYACFATHDGVAHAAAVNVGVRPTFDGHELLIEAHLLDFDDDIYESELTVRFVEYLRPELRFDGAGSLVEQMHDDVARSREILDEARSRM